MVAELRELLEETACWEGCPMLVADRLGVWARGIRTVSEGPRVKGLQYLPHLFLGLFPPRLLLAFV